MFAHPEKALLDLLYLYPFYNTKEALKELRLDEEWLSTELDVVRLDDYTARFSNKTLAKRVQLMRTTYSL